MVSDIVERERRQLIDDIIALSPPYCGRVNRARRILAEDWSFRELRTLRDALQNGLLKATGEEK